MGHLEWARGMVTWNCPINTVAEVQIHVLRFITVVCKGWLPFVISLDPEVHVNTNKTGGKASALSAQGAVHLQLGGHNW